MQSLVSALNIDSIPQISLGSAALLIFGAIASLAVLRGLLRILWGCTVLCLSGFAGFLVWNHSHPLASRWFGQDSAWAGYVLPLLGSLSVFLILRALGRFAVRPWGESNEEIAEKNRSSPIRWATTLLLSLIPTALIWFAGATLLRHAGSVAELRTYVEEIAHEPVSDRTAFLARLKEDIENAVPSEWFTRVDPLTSDIRLTLAKLISSADEPAPKAIAVLEEPETRAIILGDPDLRRLAREGRYSEILRDPRLDRMLENDNLREVLQGLDL